MQLRKIPSMILLMSLLLCFSTLGCKQRQNNASVVVLPRDWPISYVSPLKGSQQTNFPADFIKIGYPSGKSTRTERLQMPRIAGSGLSDMNTWDICYRNKRTFEDNTIDLEIKLKTSNVDYYCTYKDLSMSTYVSSDRLIMITFNKSSSNNSTYILSIGISDKPLPEMTMINGRLL